MTGINLKMIRKARISIRVPLETFPNNINNNNNINNKNNNDSKSNKNSTTKSYNKKKIMIIVIKAMFLSSAKFNMREN